jgi:hypothetical protein
LRVTVITVDERYGLAGEDVARVHDAMRREDDPRVAIGVAAAEVIKVDLVRAFADGHPVLEGALRHPVVVVLFEDRHLLHVRFRVFLDDDVNGRRERDVAADVIAVGVRVDQQRHRLRRQLLDFREDWLPPARVLRIDHRYTVGHDEDGRVAAAAGAAQHEQVVFDLLHFDDFRRIRRGLLRRHDGDAADRHQHA